MSLKSIDSDDLTAFSSTSSNTDANISVRDYLKEDDCFRPQMSTHETINNSIYSSLFKTAAVPDNTGNMVNHLMTNTEQPSLTDLVGEARCTPPQSSPSPSIHKVPCRSPPDPYSTGAINWNSMEPHVNSPVSDPGGATSANHPSPYNTGVSSPHSSNQQYSPSPSYSNNHETYNTYQSCSNNQSTSHSIGPNQAQPSYATVDSRYCPFSTINADCFSAAISENTVPKHFPKTDTNYTLKAKQLKFRGLSSYVYNRDNSNNFSSSNLNNSAGSSRVYTSISLTGHQMSKQSYTCTNGNITQTTFTSVTTPSLVNTGHASQISPKPGTSSEGQQQLQAPNQDLKKFRYNQTAMALQQSGLMKTTMKTADLLRKSRQLQQELLKLRKETAIFMQSVLNNPENQHLKDLYLPKKQTPPSSNS